MALSMYQATIPPLVHSLSNLVGILEKGAAYAEAKKMEPSVLLSTRLYPDMFPLRRQVQIASDIARRGAARHFVVRKLPKWRIMSPVFSS